MSSTSPVTRNSFNYKPPDEMEIAKEDLKRINDYDYNKMIEDFQLRDSMVKERKKRLKHLVEVNKNYSSRVDTMKETVRSAEFEKIQKCKREIEDKNRRYEAQREQIRNQNDEKNIKNKNIMKEKEKNAKRNHKIVLEKQEERRLEEAKRTQDRLRDFVEKSEEQKYEKQKLYEDKMKQNAEYHEKNVKKRDEQYEQSIKERDEKAFEKYTKNYWSRKERIQQRKENKQKELKHLEMIKEIKEQEEERRLKKQKEYMKKINNMINKRLKLEEKKQAEYENIINEQKQKFEKTRTNLENSKKTDEMIRLNILEYQRALVFRGLDKEEATTQKKSNARENIILNQLEVNKKIAQFHKDLNKIKDCSILKKSFEQRKQIYKDLLKAEADKKKKEQEEKMLNSK